MSAPVAANKVETKALGRYALMDELARGGMATVHLGRLLGPVGFSRMVAIKRLHAHLCADETFVSMLLDEARLAARIRHPNVVAMLDVVQTNDEVSLVMEYVAGESLMRLLRLVKARGERIPPAVASAILIDTLRGLHAAHEAKSERGEPLELIHRDFTPHNIMVRPDGSALVVDFGVAKAVGRLHTTEEGAIKGKLPYMAPEQVRAGALTRRVDVYAAGAVLWEALVGERAISGATEPQILERLLYGEVPAPSTRVPEVGTALDAVVLRALARDPSHRFATAAEMATALEGAEPPALPSRVAAWIDRVAGDQLRAKATHVAELEARGLGEDDSGPAMRAVPAAPPSVRSAVRERVTETRAATPVALLGEHSELRAHTTAAPVPTRGARPGVVAAVTAAVLLPLAWLGFRAYEGARGTASATAQAAPPGPTSSEPAPTVSAMVVSVAASATAGVSVSTTPSASAPASSSVPPARPRPTAPIRKPRCAAVTVDASGKKLFHPECMDDH